MTREEAITNYIVPAIKRTWNDKKCIEILKALEQEPCDDVISRQAVFEQINCWIGSGEYRYTNATDYLNKRIKALQAVNPQEPIYYPPCEDCHNKMNEIRKAYDKIQSAEPKTGHWIIYDVHGHKACKCSECDKDVGYPCNDKYCPNCGAKMVEPQESEEQE